jgi:uncharacterized integral membrane protein
MGLMQKLRGIWDRVRLLLVAVLTAAALLFALQNLHAVRIDIVFWQIDASASLLVLGSFLVGLLVGALTTFYYKGRFSLANWARKKAVAAKSEAEGRAVAAEDKVRALPAEAAPSPPEGGAAAEQSASKEEAQPHGRPPGGKR